MGFLKWTAQFFHAVTVIYKGPDLNVLIYRLTTFVHITGNLKYKVLVCLMNACINDW